MVRKVAVKHMIIQVGCYTDTRFKHLALQSHSMNDARSNIDHCSHAAELTAVYGRHRSKRNRKRHQYSNL